MKKQLQDVIKNLLVSGKKAFSKAKFIAGANAVAILFAGSVGAKDLSTKECLEQFQGADFNTTDPEATGCICDAIHILLDEKTGDIVNYRRMSCRAKTQKEKDEYCKKNFDGKLLKENFAKMDKAGCTCDNVVTAFDTWTSNIDFVQGNCRALTAEEKALSNLINNRDFECVDEGCKTLVDLKCAKVDKPNIENGLSDEEYQRILQQAKECQTPAKKLIQQVINEDKVR